MDIYRNVPDGPIGARIIEIENKYGLRGNKEPYDLEPYSVTISYYDAKIPPEMVSEIKAAVQELGGFVTIHQIIEL